MILSSKGFSEFYLRKSKQTVSAITDLNECIKKRVLHFIEKYHPNGSMLFWFDLTTAHYSNIVRELLYKQNTSFVLPRDNLLNESQACSIETHWTLLKHQVYENDGDSKSLDVSSRRINQKAKELAIEILGVTIEGS